MTKPSPDLQVFHVFRVGEGRMVLLDTAVTAPADATIEEVQKRAEALGYVGALHKDTQVEPLL